MKNSSLLECIESSATTTAGTGIVQCPTEVFGGALIYADGTNPVTVTVRRTDGSGKVIFRVKTLTGGAFHGPYAAGTATLHWTVAGTGGDASLYQWGKSGR